MMALKSTPTPRGRLLKNEPMSRHTSWRVGGPADSLYIPADLDDLAVFLKGLPADEPVHCVGLGSNLLVRDGGMRGTVIVTSGALSGLALSSDIKGRHECAGAPSLEGGRRRKPQSSYQGWRKHGPRRGRRGERQGGALQHRPRS